MAHMPHLNGSPSWREGAACSRGPPNHHQPLTHHMGNYDEVNLSHARPVHAMLGIKTEPEPCEEQMEACGGGNNDANFMNSLRDMGLGLTDSSEFSAVLNSLLSQFGMNVPGVQGQGEGMEGVEGAGVGVLPDVIPPQAAHYVPQPSPCPPPHQGNCGPGLVPCARPQQTKHYEHYLPPDHSRMSHEASAFLAAAERQANHEEEFNWDKLL